MGLLDRIFRNTPKRNKDTGNTVERYRKSFLHAIDGIVYAFKFEHNMIIILISTIVSIACGFIFNISIYEWLFIIIICGVIAACEMINSSIEATIDLITTDMHPLAKIAKDTASSATLFLCITALVGGLIIFIPKIVEVLW